MGIQLFKNNAASNLSGALSQGGTTVQLIAGTGDGFPSIAAGSGDFFLVTLFEKDNAGAEERIEVVKVTNRVGDTLTVVRDFEGMTNTVGGYAYPSIPSATVYVELRWTAAGAGNFMQKGGSLSGIADPAAARTNLEISAEHTPFTPYGTLAATNVQAAIQELVDEKQELDATLTALGSVTATTDKLPYFTGNDTADVTTLTGFARGLLDDVSALEARGTLGLNLVDNTSDATKNAATVTLTNKTINLANNTLVATSAQLAAAVSDETGTGSLVFATSPTLVTPNLGVATATTVNKLTITAPATSATLTVANGKTFTASNTITLTGFDNASLNVLSGGTVAYRADTLDVFAATSSSQLRTVISDETGTGSLVFATSPTLVTPVLGVATATTINKVAFTTPLTGATLTIADGKTLTANNSLTFTGTDLSTVNFQGGGTVAYSGGTLAQFNATTSAQLAGVITDETGTGALVFAGSPALTGTPTAPTAAVSTNTTQLATTAFVVAQVANDAPTKAGSGATGTWGISISGSAPTLTTARTISLTGDVTWSQSFNGSANVTGTATLANSGVTAGTYTKVTVDAKGRVTVGAAITSSDVTTALGFTPANKAGDTFSGKVTLNTTDAVKVPVGTTAQRPGGVTGDFRFNSTFGKFEGYNGSAWGAVGGGATGGGGDEVFIENDTTVTQNYTITAGKNAGTFGPVSVANGAVVTIPDGSVWAII